MQKIEKFEMKQCIIECEHTARGQIAPFRSEIVDQAWLFPD